MDVGPDEKSKKKSRDSTRDLSKSPKTPRSPVEASPLLQKLGLKTPIFVAPMAGGPTTVSLTSAACESGALGSLAGAYSDAKALRELILETRKSTSNAFCVNLFVPAKTISISEPMLKAAIDATRPYRRELEIQDPVLKPPYEENFEEQFAVILELKPAALSFIFGSIGPEKIAACRKAGILTFGTATNLDEAFKLQADGVDAVIAQGDEAGGHRGFFAADQTRNGLKIRDLLGELAAAKKQGRFNLPIIAAGGIMNGRNIDEMLALGADAVQMGTAFLACGEAGTNAPYLKTLLSPAPKTTALTRAFSGRWARGIENRFMKAMQDSDAILPFPAQNVFTRDIRNASFKKATPDYMSLWAGTGVGEIRGLPANDLIELLENERQAAAQART